MGLLQGCSRIYNTHLNFFFFFRLSSQLFNLKLQLSALRFHSIGSSFALKQQIALKSHLLPLYNKPSQLNSSKESLGFLKVSANCNNFFTSHLKNQTFSLLTSKFNSSFLPLPHFFYDAKFQLLKFKYCLCLILTNDPDILKVSTSANCQNSRQVLDSPTFSVFKFLPHCHSLLFQSFSISTN